MNIELTSFDNDYKASVNFDDIKFIIGFRNGSIVKFKKSIKDFYVKESVSQITDIINKLRKNYSGSFAIYYSP